MRPEAHIVELDDGSTLEYDYLVSVRGGRFKPALDGATTFPAGDKSFSADEILDRAEGKDHRLAFIVPSGVVWSLPLYETRADDSAPRRQRGLDVKIAIITPEPAPSGDLRARRRAGGQRVARARRIDVFAGRRCGRWTRKESR